MISDNVTITFDITNTGQYDGDEVAQLYVRDDVSSVTTPVKQLKSFTRINIPQGQTVRELDRFSSKLIIWIPIPGLSDFPTERPVRPHHHQS